MQVERFSTDIHLPHTPRTGKEAYSLLIQSLKSEIQEKQDILSELTTDVVKKMFIDNWNPVTRSVNIYEQLGDD